MSIRAVVLLVAVWVGSVVARRGAITTQGSFSLSNIASSNRAGNDELDVELSEPDTQVGETLELGDDSGSPSHCDSHPDWTWTTEARPQHSDMDWLRECNTTAKDSNGTVLKLNFGLPGNTYYKGQIPLCASCKVDECGHYMRKMHNKGGVCTKYGFESSPDRWNKCDADCFKSEWDLNQDLWSGGRIEQGYPFVCTRMCSPRMVSRFPEFVGRPFVNKVGKGYVYCDVLKHTSCAQNPQYNSTCSTDCAPELNCNVEKRVTCNRICNHKPKKKGIDTDWSKPSVQQVCNTTCDRKYCDVVASWA